VDNKVRSILLRQITEEDRPRPSSDLRHAPAWMPTCCAHSRIKCPIREHLPETPVRTNVDSPFSRSKRSLALQAVSVEKDFWVCWTLRELFTLPGIGDSIHIQGRYFAPKGMGGLIPAVSEDIASSVDKEAMGFEGDLPRIRRQSKNTQGFVGQNSSGKHRANGYRATFNPLLGDSLKGRLVGGWLAAGN